MNKDRSATKSYIHAADEFEKVERILLYLKVSDFFINEDNERSLKELRRFNQGLEVPYDLTPSVEKQFLELRSYEKTLSTIMYIRAIDNFTNYFKDILSEVVLVKPSLLKSSEKESLDYILSYNNLEDLIKGLAEKKIESLFYAGISDIQKYFKERLGLELFKDNFYEINLLFKQRNLAVHNRSKISKEFAKQFPKENFIDGHYLNFTFEYTQKVVLALYKIINTVDHQISAKFNLKIVEF